MKKYWFPVAVVLLIAVLIVVVFFIEKIQFARYLAAILLTLLGGLIILVWYLLRRDVTWKRKRWVLVVSLLVPILFLGVFRVEYAGAGYPNKFVPRWTPVAGSDLAELSPTPTALLTEAAQAVPNENAEVMKAAYNFSGPGRIHTIPERAFSTDWSANPPKELWRRDVGTGWGSFSVAQGRAFTMEQRGDEELTICYHLLTGEPLWATSREVRFDEGMSGSGPRSTPFIDGERLYALGGVGDLACQSVKDGSIIWQRNILKGPGNEDRGNLYYGKACTPLRVGDLVVVTGGKRGGSLLAYNAESGEPVWVGGDASEESRYASPAMATLAGRDMILAVNQNSLTGHAPDTGEVILRIDWPGGGFPKSSQPIPIGGDRLFCTASYGMNSFVAEISEGADGKLTSKDVWRRNRMKTKFSTSPPYKGYSYGLDEGIFCCVDLADGEKIWKGGRYGYGQNLLVEDVVVMQMERTGEIVLIEPNPTELKELARLEALSGKTWNAPSIAGRYLLVRNGQEAACFELPAR